MYHIVYKTVNKVNSKYYIGVHSTKDLNDGYLGSGKNLKRAIAKYGKEAFERQILCFFSERDNALIYEKTLVTREITNLTECYNIVEGGGNPPSKAGIANPKTKLKGDDRTDKQKLAAKIRAEKVRGRPAYNRKEIEMFGSKFGSITEAIKHYGLSRSHYDFWRRNPQLHITGPEDLKKASWEARNSKISRKRRERNI